MEHLEHAPNHTLLSTLAGPSAAQILMERYDGLTSLARASVDELQAVKGIGKGKAAAIKAAFLLAQRLSRETSPEPPLLDSPEKVADLLREQNRLYTVEMFQAAFLNARRYLIGVQLIAQGTLDTVVVHPRELFAAAIQRRAASVVLVHNHPSGDPTPSESDVRITRELVRAGQLMRIDVTDHIILGRPTTERPQDFVSLRVLGYLAF